MSATLFLPCKCKLCGAVIGDFSLEWPPPKDNAAQEAANQQQFGKFFRQISEHLVHVAQLGPKNSQAHEHAAVLMMAQATGGNLVTLKIAESFDIPQAAALYLHGSRQAIHQMTRSFWMTDADIERLADATEDRAIALSQELGPGEGKGPYISATCLMLAITQLLRSLRDQYEAGAEQPQQKQPPSPRLVTA